MDGKEAANFMARARYLRELATTIKSEHQRQLLLDSAEKFEKLAQQTLKSELKR